MSGITVPVGGRPLRSLVGWPLRSRLASVLAVAGLLATGGLTATPAQAAKFRVSGGCDCSSSQSGGYCNASSVTYTASTGASMTVNFADPDGSGPENGVYQCGQYANGDVWVAGKSNGSGGTVVRVGSTTPNWANTSGEGCTSCSEGKNGWMTDPTSIGEQRLDGRVKTGSFTKPTSAEPLPRSYDVTSGYRSFIKDVGRNTTNANTGSFWLVCNTGNNHFQCSRFNATVTMVECASGCSNPADTDGDGSTADEFRPSWFGAGADKVARVRVDQLDLSTLGQLDRTQISQNVRNGWSFRDVRDFYRWQRLDHMSGWSQWVMMGLDNFGSRPGGFSGASRQEYGVEMMSINSAALMRLALDDWQLGVPGDDSYQALVNVVQIGLDNYGIYRAGGKKWRNGESFRNAGGHHGGRKVLGVFAAHLLRSHPNYGSSLSAWVQGDNFFEDVEANRGSDGRAYYGIVVGDCDGWLDRDGNPAPSSGRGQCQSYLSGNSPNASNAASMDSYCRHSSSYPARQVNMARYQRVAVTALGMEDLWADDAYLELAYGWAEGGRAPGHTGGHWCGTDGPSQGWTTGQNTKGGSQSVSEHDIGEAMWAAFKDFVAEAPPASGGPPLPPVLLDF